MEIKPLECSTYLLLGPCSPPCLPHAPFAILTRLIGGGLPEWDPCQLATFPAPEPMRDTVIVNFSRDSEFTFQLYYQRAYLTITAKAMIARVIHREKSGTGANPSAGTKTRWARTSPCLPAEDGLLVLNWSDFTN